MRTINLLSVEVLSNRELANVRGGEGIPTPIIVIEEGYAVPASAVAVETLTTLFVPATTTTAPTKPKKTK